MSKETEYVVFIRYGYERITAFVPKAHHPAEALELVEDEMTRGDIRKITERRVIRVAEMMTAL